MSHCPRCYEETNITIMSMFNTDILCMSCKKKEKEDPRYKEAQEAERRAVQSGNYNFPGIGR